MSRHPKPRKWTPKNPHKYKGDPNNIIARSSWELQTFKWFDLNENVIEWGSETVIVPYFSPVDNKWHRYFPDILAKIKSRDNRITTYLIEIKPEYQTKAPEIKKRITKQYVNEVCTYAINTAKWRAAEEYALDRKWVFMKLTEKELFNKK